MYCRRNGGKNNMMIINIILACIVLVGAVFFIMYMMFLYALLGVMSFKEVNEEFVRFIKMFFTW